MRFCPVIQGIPCWQLALLCLFWVLIATPVAAEDEDLAELRVRVVDKEDGRPIVGAMVQIAGDMKPSDEDGLARFEVQAEASALLMSVDAPAYFVHSATLPAARRSSSLPTEMNVELIRFEQLRFHFSFYDSTLPIPFITHNSTIKANGRLTLADQEFAVVRGKARVDLDLERLRLRSTLAGGAKPMLQVELSGYRPTTFQAPMLESDYIETIRTSSRSVISGKPRTWRIPIVLEAAAREDVLRLILNLHDTRSGGVLRRTAQVRLPGFGQQTSTSGQVIFTLKREDLQRFKDRFGDRITVETSTMEYRDGSLELAITTLLEALDRGESKLTESVMMEPAPTRPAMTLQLEPPLQTAARDQAIAWQYQLTNTGNSGLQNIVVSDPNCAPVDVIAGDINGNDRLDVGETWWLECTGVAHETFSSSVRATAETTSGKSISATAMASLVVTDCAAGQQAMPALVGMSPSAALALLKRLGIDSPMVAEVESNDAAPDTIFEQQPQPEACIDITSAAIWLNVAVPLALPEPEPAGSLEAELECAEGLEITAGARPSRTCWLAVRNWAPTDEHVRMAVTLPGGTSLDVWPMNDSAWPPNMHNPGVADLRFKQRYIFTLLFSAPITATPEVVTVGITVSQRGHGRVNLELPVSILPPGRMPSRGSGIRPPVAMADGTGDYCVWRYKAFGDPPNCFLFNIATCDTVAYDGNARYERVGQNMTKLEASVLMSRLSSYGGDAYGCRQQREPDPAEQPPLRRCSDGSMVASDQPCPNPTRQCPDGSEVPVDDPCPPPDVPNPEYQCLDGTMVIDPDDCPDINSDPEAKPDQPGGLDCRTYGQQAELYFDDDRQEYLCRCKPGHAFHVSERCVPDQDLEQCLDYPGTFPYNGVCQCLYADEYWSEGLGRCAAIEDWPEEELADCSAWPGTLPLPDPFDGELRCTCPLGTDWSDDLKRCVTQADTEVAGTDCSHQPGTVAQMDYYTNTAVCACPGADETWDADAGQCTSAGATGSGSTPVGNDPDPPPPTDVQPGQCNDQTTSGSDEPVRVQIPVSGETGVELTYDTVNVKDRVRAFIDGQLTFDSGCVGTDGDAHQTISMPVGAQVLEIDVYPNCESSDQTKWSFSVDCAGSDPNGGQ